MKKEDIEGLEGFGEKSADNIITSIDGARKVPLHRFVYALGIRHVGEQTAKDIAKHFRSLARIQDATFDELSSVEGVGEKVGKEVNTYFSLPETKQLLKRLCKEITLLDEEILPDGKLFNKLFVITGTLPTLSRDEAKVLIEKNGGRVQTSVSTRTSYLLAGENAGSKLTDAEKIGTVIITEDELKSML